MTAIPAFSGQCRVASLVTTPNPFVGSIADHGLVPVFAPVRLNQPENTWVIASQPNNHGLRFSIGEFPYTGVDQKTDKVISTFDADQDVKWYVSYREAQNAFTIEAGYDRNQVWTISDTSDTSSPIVVSTIKIIASEPGLRYLPSQLFKPVQLGGLD